jgi:hypothetical protein
MPAEEYESIIQDIFALPKKKIKLDPHWRDYLLNLERPSALVLLPQIVGTNSLGFDYGPTVPKKNSLLEYVLQQKNKYPDKLILTRVGQCHQRQYYVA